MKNKPSNYNCPVCGFNRQDKRHKAAKCDRVWQKKMRQESKTIAEAIPT